MTSKSLVIISLWVFLGNIESKDSDCQQKVLTHQRCVLNNTDAEQRLTESVNKAIAQSTNYLQRKLATQSELPDHVSAWISHSLALSASGPGACTDDITNKNKQISSLGYNDLKALSGGRLAMVLIGKQASCGFKSKEMQHKLMLVMNQKMKAFPKGEFNNYFQYSLAIIALYNNGEYISHEFGKELLQGVFLTNRKQQQASDTESIALVALKAITKQKFNSHWTKKHALRELEKARKRIDRIFEKEENFITMLLIAQVFDFKKKTYCKKMIEHILSEQLEDGSFGPFLLKTAWAIETLSGKSTLDMRDVKCPEKTNIVEEEEGKNENANNKAKEIGKGIQTETKEIGKGIQTETKKQEDRKPIKVSVHIEYDGLTSSMETVAVPTGASAMDALESASRANPCFKFRTKATAWGPQITQICNIEQSNEKKAYWVFYVNDQMGKVGASAHTLFKDDVVKFRLQRF